MLAETGSGCFIKAELKNETARACFYHVQVKPQK